MSDGRNKRGTRTDVLPMEMVGRRKRGSKGSRTHRGRIIGWMTRGNRYARVIRRKERVIRRRGRKASERRKLREIEGIDASLLKNVRIYRTRCGIWPTRGIWINDMSRGRPRNARC